MTIPAGPIEHDPVETYRGLDVAQVGILLDEALGGVELCAYDQWVVEWLETGCDSPTIVTVASLLQRCRGLDTATSSSTAS